MAGEFDILAQISEEIALLAFFWDRSFRYGSEAGSFNETLDFWRRGRPRVLVTTVIEDCNVRSISLLDTGSGGFKRSEGFDISVGGAENVLIFVSFEKAWKMSFIFQQGHLKVTYIAFFSQSPLLAAWSYDLLALIQISK